MPFLVVIPHLFLIFYPVQECEATIEALSRIKSDEKNELCHNQDEMTKLRGVNIDILCPGDLVQCMCHVRSRDNGQLIRKVKGRRDHQLCSCSNAIITLHQIFVTRAVCCTGPRTKSTSRQVIPLICPPHLPHIARFRSRKGTITCPAPSAPYKCICLKGDIGAVNNTRSFGKILENTCTCGERTEVTRAICCHSHDSYDFKQSVLTI